MDAGEISSYSGPQRIYDVMTEIARQYNRALNTATNARVLDWLTSKYAITRETIDQLLIGWSGEDAQSTFDVLVADGHKPPDLHATGFFRTSQGALHPYFANRIVFPYWHAGRVVYAIGRKTPWTADNEYERAKYKKLAQYDPKKRPYIHPAIHNPALYGEDVLLERPRRVLVTEGIQIS
jgi:DNA primase